MTHWKWQPLIWIGAYILLLLSLMTPFNAITVCFLMIPIVFLFVTLTVTQFVIGYLAAVAVLFLLAGTYAFPLALISVLFLGPAVVMGVMYKRKMPALTVVVAGTGSLIAVMLAGLLVSYLGGINLIDFSAQYIRESFATLPENMRQGLPENFIENAIDMTSRMIPFYMITFSLVYSAVTHAVSRRVLKLAGIEVPAMKPIKEWMLPKSLVWYYLLALILELIVPPESDSVLVTFLWNLIPLLMLVFSLQAISFLSFIADAKKWNKTLPILGIVAFPLVPSLVSLLGVFDVAFNIRKMIKP